MLVEDLPRRPQFPTPAISMLLLPQRPPRGVLKSYPEIFWGVEGKKKPPILLLFHFRTLGYYVYLHRVNCALHSSCGSLSSRYDTSGAVLGAGDGKRRELRLQ